MFRAYAVAYLCSLGRGGLLKRTGGSLSMHTQRHDIQQRTAGGSWPGEELKRMLGKALKRMLKAALDVFDGRGWRVSLSMHTHRPKMWHGMAGDSGPAVGLWPRSQNKKWEVISLKKALLYLSVYSPIPSLLFTSINHCLSYCIRTCVLWKQGCIPIIHTFKVFANTLHGDNIHDWVCGRRH